MPRKHGRDTARLKCRKEELYLLGDAAEGEDWSWGKPETGSQWDGGKLRLEEELGGWD